MALPEFGRNLAKRSLQEAQDQREQTSDQFKDISDLVREGSLDEVSKRLQSAVNSLADIDDTRKQAEYFEGEFVEKLQAIFEEAGLDPDMPTDEFMEILTGGKRESEEITIEPEIEEGFIEEQVAPEQVHEVFTAEPSEQEAETSLIEMFEFDDLTERQYMSLRVGLRLADDLSTPVTTRSTFSQMAESPQYDDLLEDLKEDSFNTVLNRVRGNVQYSIYKLEETIGEETRLPLTKQQIEDLEASGEVEDILVRLSSIQEYDGMNVGEIKDFLTEHKHDELQFTVREELPSEPGKKKAVK